MRKQLSRNDVPVPSCYECFVTFVRLSEFIFKQTSDYSQKYEDSLRRSLEEPEEFWAEVGRCVTWTKPWDKVLDNTNEPFTKW